jgi:Helix-turn-helix domain
MLFIMTGEREHGEREHGAPPDPRALRALAHPLRWKLIDLLGSETTATATRCAEVLGESVASCSYHLGILGKYGYTELVGGQQGREKPWRLASLRQDLSPPGLDLEGALAAEAATEVFLDHELARLKDRLRHRDLEPEPWRQASRMLGVSTWMTVAELQEATDQLMHILNRHAPRDEDPAARPEGAREVRLFAATSVRPPVTPRGRES